MLTDLEISNILKSQKYRWSFKVNLINNLYKKRPDIKQLAYDLYCHETFIVKSLQLAQFLKSYPTLVSVSSRKEAEDLIDLYGHNPEELRHQITLTAMHNLRHQQLKEKLNEYKSQRRDEQNITRKFRRH